MQRKERLSGLETTVELVPVVGAMRAIYSFDQGRDTLPTRQDQTFGEALNRSLLFTGYHAAWSVVIGYHAYNFLK
ncbi:hypothetical protein HYV86_02395 [Candidatus Woesearchaeota archaeon]|nr:hypothetical protein [Candidatus Woesearchaeota archaeon]